MLLIIYSVVGALFQVPNQPIHFPVSSLYAACAHVCSSFQHCVEWRDWGSRRGESLERENRKGAFGAMMPILLQEDPLHMKYRSENDLLAFTWWHFMYYSNEPEYVAFLPMVKVLQISYILCIYRSSTYLCIYLHFHMHAAGCDERTWHCGWFRIKAEAWGVKDWQICGHWSFQGTSANKEMHELAFCL